MNGCDLKPCRACYEMVRPESPSCPYCGQSHPTRSTWQGALVALLAVLLCLKLDSIITLAAQF